MPSLIESIRDQQFLALGEDISSIEAALLARLLNDLNAVGQALYTQGPGSWWGEGPQGDRLRAPTSLSSVTSTDGSKTIACASFAAWMNGCTVNFNGEWNRIFQTGASTWELLIPANVTTAAGSLIVYHDCLNLTDTSIALSRVILDGYGELANANNVADLEQTLCRSVSFGIPPAQYLPSWWWGGLDRQIDIPRQYAIDGTQLYGGSWVTQIRVNPLPDKSFAIHWTQREKFAKVTSWADTRTSIVPHDYHESVFLPLVLEKLLKHPSFEGDKDEIRTDAARAREIMETLSKPQQDRKVRISTRGGY